MLVESLVFTLVFWGILWLCALLFVQIKINFFVQILSKAWFALIVTPIIFNGMISFLQERSNKIKVVHHHLLNIFTGLLPLISFIAIIFAIAIMFTCLESLWATKFATLIISVLQVTVIFLLNAFYKDGSSQAVYNKWVMYLINTSIVLLPIYSIIAIYSLSLRVIEYGLSVERVWAILIISQIAVYSFGYMFVTFKSRFITLAKLDNINIIAAILWMCFLILFNSTILDPRVVTIDNQASRLENGIITAKEFDTKYINNLGKIGKEKIQYLKNHGYDLRLTEIDSPLANADLEKNIILLPKGKLEASLITYLANAEPRLSANCMKNSCVAMQINLMRDNIMGQYLIFSPSHAIIMYKNAENAWQKVANVNGWEFNLNNIILAIKSNKIRAIPPVWDDLEIDGKRYNVQSTK